MKINETRKRSLLKAVSFRVIEVAIDTVVLWYAYEMLQPFTPAKAFALAVFMEATCFSVHYIFERVWNKTDYGREIV